MDQGNSKPVPRFLSRDWFFKRGQRLAVYIALFAIAAVFIYRAINPTHINHLVVISLDDQEFESPFTAKLVGEIDWEQTVFFAGRRPGAEDLGVSNISRAWGDGRLTITDNKGTEVVNMEIEPRGRYCGALVILIDENGQAHAAWNEVPDPDL